MPKVVISNSKGLVQQSGSGFELSDSHVKPASETCRHASQLLTFSGPDVDGAINGTYFDISSVDVNYRVYFDIAGDESAEPEDLAGRTAVMADLSGAVDTDAASAAEQAEAVEAALDALDFISDDTAADGTLDVFCDTPGALKGDFDAGTTAEAGHETAATCTTTDGSGQLALTVDKRVSVIGQTAATGLNAEITGQNAFTLANGAYAGQEKVILLDGIGTEAHTVTLTGYTSAGDNGLGALTMTLTHAANTACNAHLLWDGAGWVLLASNGGVAVA